MARYTTGELAELCDVTVRTVQFYDLKGLLKPSDLTEGGRRLYGDADLQRMRSQGHCCMSQQWPCWLKYATSRNVSTNERMCKCFRVVTMSNNQL